MLLDGLLHRDELRDRTGTELPDGDVDTLGVFIQDTLGRIPAVGDQVPLPDAGLVVNEMDAAVSRPCATSGGAPTPVHRRRPDQPLASASQQLAE
jgi:Transporter associated domain